jgi:hypothetical protein
MYLDELKEKPPDSREVRGLRSSAAWYYRRRQFTHKTHESGCRVIILRDMEKPLWSLKKPAGRGPLHVGRDAASC